MDVYIRHIHDSESQFFTECEWDDFQDIVVFIKNSSGFYNLNTGDQDTFNSYQLCYGENKAFAEIIIGRDEEVDWFCSCGASVESPGMICDKCQNPPITKVAEF